MSLVTCLGHIGKWVWVDCSHNIKSPEPNAVPLFFLDYTVIADFLVMIKTGHHMMDRQAQRLVHLLEQDNKYYLSFI